MKCEHERTMNAILPTFRTIHRVQHERFRSVKFPYRLFIVNTVGSPYLSEFFIVSYRTLPQQTVYSFKIYGKIDEKRYLLLKRLAFLTLIYPIAWIVP